MLDSRSLTREQQRQLRAHVADCPACAAEFAGLQMFDRCFAEVGEDAPDGFADRVWCRLKEKNVADVPAHGVYAVLGAVVAAEVAVMMLLGSGPRGFVFGLLKGALRILTERIAPSVFGAVRSLFMEVAQVRLPAVPVHIDWSYVAVCAAVVAVFALFTIHREGSRHA